MKISHTLMLINETNCGIILSETYYCNVLIFILFHMSYVVIIGFLCLLIIGRELE